MSHNLFLLLLWLLSGRHCVRAPSLACVVPQRRSVVLKPLTSPFLHFCQRPFVAHLAVESVPDDPLEKQCYLLVSGGVEQLADPERAFTCLLVLVSISLCVVKLTYLVGGTLSTTASVTSSRCCSPSSLASLISLWAVTSCSIDTITPADSLPVAAVAQQFVGAFLPPDQLCCRNSHLMSSMRPCRHQLLGHRQQQDYSGRRHCHFWRVVCSHGGCCPSTLRSVQACFNSAHETL